MACSFAQINAVAINSSIASKFAVTKPRSVRSALPKPAVSLDAGLRSSLPAKKKKLSAPKLERAGSCTVRAMAEGAATATATDGSWIPVLALEGLPRGERRIVSAGGFTMILFWYKNEIVAVENRSPAEGAYSEGFKNARLTQEGGIRCPVSDSVFDLKTGEVVEWFPNNAVMRAITPKDGVKLNVFPVKVDPEKISVLVSQTVTSMGGGTFSPGLGLGSTQVTSEGVGS
eukprot:jgi/Mesvir1/603/Mv26072-RA.1